MFNIEITSVPDRENLVAEIWFNDSLIAEINNEKGVFEIELYQSDINSFNLNDFLSTLENAKNDLVK